MVTPIRLEVEDFDTRPSTFRTQDLAGIASDNQTLTVQYRSQGGPSEGDPITTSTTYGGPDGIFDALLGTFDESDGDSRIVVRIDGLEVADFLLDQDPGSSSPDATNAVQRDVATAFEINTGDLIEITVFRDAGEYVRLDFLELISVSNPPVAFKLDNIDGTNGVRFDGTGTADDTGQSVAGAGDINGDGIDDVIIGAPRSDGGGGDRAGEAYVVFGDGTGFPANLDLATLNGINGFRLDGINNIDYAGVSVNAAGDVNGDGIDDIIVGADDADPGGVSRAGEAYIVFGDAGGFAPSLNLASLNGVNGFRIDGIDQDDGLGQAVSSAGDINGDGIDDLIVSAPFADADASPFTPAAVAGESYVIYGQLGPFAPSIDPEELDGFNGFRIDGVDEGDRSGVSVSAAGDVNGDGLDDLIIGAPEADANGVQSAGKSYLVYGRDTGFGSVFELDSLDGTTGFRIDGTDETIFSGTSVSGAGDINNDGFDDLVIGADFATPDGNTTRLAGQVHVIFGSDTPFPADFDLASVDGTNGFVIDGIDANDSAGESVSSAGDFNGDGVDDFIIGAGSADRAGEVSVGESYLIYGKETGFAPSLDLEALDGTDGFRIDGVDAFDQAGTSVSAAGDINDDGFDDLIIGAPLADPVGPPNGAAYVLFGGPDGPGSAVAGYNSTPTLSGGNFAVLEDAAIGTVVGTLQASDPDGDPLTFVIIDGNDDGLFAIDAAGQITLNGAADHENGAARNLTVEVSDDKGYAPKAVTVTVAIRDVADSLFASDGYNVQNLDGANGFTIIGSERFGSTGNAVSGAGDVNDDGFDDLIVSQEGSDPDGNGQAGSTFVVFGGPNLGQTIDLATIDGTNGFRVNGKDPNDELANSVSAAGDVNGDGIDDLVLGANRVGTDDDGESYVIFGTAAGFPATFNVTALDGTNGYALRGIDADDESGFSVSGAGDINNDGLDDLIIGALGGDPDGLADAGESYVVFGDAGGFGGALDLATLNGANGFRLDGTASGDLSGISVSDAGDLNADGIDDLIVGAFQAGTAGEAYVVYGTGAGFAPDIDLATLNGINGFTIDGGDPAGTLGRSVSSAGDVNADGIDDVIIGAPSFNGQSYVLFGNAGGFGATVDLATLDGTNGFLINGGPAGGNLGRAVSGAGDVNGDGIDDVMVSADQASFGTGEAFVIFGSASPFAATFDLSTLDGSNGFSAEGVENLDAFGDDLAGAGDINGDGVDDVIFGAYDSSPIDGFPTGAAHVIFGRSDADQTIPGTDGDDLLVGGLGDDTMTGMDGADRFVISEGDDVITDFQLLDDKIGLEGLFFGPPPVDINDFVELTLTGPDAQFTFDEDGLGDFSLAGAEGTLVLTGVDFSGSTVDDLFNDGTLALIA